MEGRVPVREIMTRNVVKASPETDLVTAAKEMARRGVGSIVVTEDGTPVGIVTERDIVTKVVAEGKSPSEVRLKDIMSSPLITVDPNEDVREAAKLMVKRDIRRLPVVEGGELVGIITDTDIISISAEMGEIIETLMEMNREPPFMDEMEEELQQGICEGCGSFSENLKFVSGRLLCESCREELEEEEEE
ncbi:MAG: CBS domain-containing protein [Archaeoglobi archaeon]|nr:CBS domain-containing protein [Candidatus Mnemosynella bozhongmuii]